MKIVIFSDVHGNLPAFQQMLDAAGPCDGYICLGDLVNYGPWSNECVELALSLPSCEYVRGNHEEAFIQGRYTGNHSLVKKFFDITNKGFEYREQIRNFKATYKAFGYSFQHTILNSNIYPDTTVSLDANYVIGHSHYQFLYKNRDYILYNAGSVGQNRQYINIINYLILDADQMKFTLCELKYDVDEVIGKMKSEGYPDECISYYTSKPRK